MSSIMSDHRTIDRQGIVSSIVESVFFLPVSLAARAVPIHAAAKPRSIRRTAVLSCTATQQRGGGLRPRLHGQRAKAVLPLGRSSDLLQGRRADTYQDARRVSTARSSKCFFETTDVLIGRRLPWHNGSAVGTVMQGSAADGYGCVGGWVGGGYRPMLADGRATTMAQPKIPAFEKRIDACAHSHRCSRMPHLRLQVRPTCHR